MPDAGICLPLWNQRLEQGLSPYPSPGIVQAETLVVLPPGPGPASDLGLASFIQTLPLTPRQTHAKIGVVLPVEQREREFPTGNRRRGKQRTDTHAGR